MIYYPNAVKANMSPTITVRATAAAIGPGVGSMAIVIHKMPIKSAQKNPRSFDADGI
jgi:hypothetical protein